MSMKTIKIIKAENDDNVNCLAQLVVGSAYGCVFNDIDCRCCIQKIGSGDNTP